LTEKKSIMKITNAACLIFTAFTTKTFFVTGKLRGFRVSEEDDLHRNPVENWDNLEMLTTEHEFDPCLKDEDCDVEKGQSCTEGRCIINQIEHSRYQMSLSSSGERVLEDDKESFPDGELIPHEEYKKAFDAAEQSIDIINSLGDIESGNDVLQFLSNVGNVVSIFVPNFATVVAGLGVINALFNKGQASGNDVEAIQAELNGISNQLEDIEGKIDDLTEVIIIENCKQSLQDQVDGILVPIVNQVSNMNDGDKSTTSRLAKICNDGSKEPMVALSYIENFVYGKQDFTHCTASYEKEIQGRKEKYRKLITVPVTGYVARIVRYVGACEGAINKHDSKRVSALQKRIDTLNTYFVDTEREMYEQFSSNVEQFYGGDKYKSPGKVTLELEKDWDGNFKYGVYDLTNPNEKAYKAYQVDDPYWGFHTFEMKRNSESLLRVIFWKRILNDKDSEDPYAFDQYNKPEIDFHFDECEKSCMGPGPSNPRYYLKYGWLGGWEVYQLDEKFEEKYSDQWKEVMYRGAIIFKEQYWDNRHDTSDFDVMAIDDYAGALSIQESEFLTSFDGYDSAETLQYKLLVFYDNL